MFASCVRQGWHLGSTVSHVHQLLANGGCCFPELPFGSRKGLNASLEECSDCHPAPNIMNCTHGFCGALGFFHTHLIMCVTIKVFDSDMTEVFACVAELVGSSCCTWFSGHSHIGCIQCHVGTVLSLAFLCSLFPGPSDDQQGSPDVLRVEEISCHFSTSVTKIGVPTWVYSPSGCSNKKISITSAAKNCFSRWNKGHMVQLM